MRARHIHVFGASGSGTSSLAAALAARHGHRHLDTDDFYWMPTDPPFQAVRPRAERLTRLEAALERWPTWVLSGSLCGWGDPLIPRFDLVVFLWVPTDVRMARLRAREQQRYGAEAIAPGGSLHRGHVEFMSWAAGYDDGGPRDAQPGDARGVARRPSDAGGETGRRSSARRAAGAPPAARPRIRRRLRRVPPLKPSRGWGIVTSTNAR